MLNRSPHPPRPSRRRLPRARYLVTAGVAVLAVLAGFLLPVVFSSLSDTSAKDRIEADPPPTLFPPAEAARVDDLTSAQQARADALLKPWWAEHGTTADDAAFTAWLVETFPAPPDPAARQDEMTEVERLDARRTPTGIAAATWLEAYGKKDVWKLEVHDQAELLPATTGETRKSAVDDLLSMSKDVADRLGTRFQQSAPYVLEPALRTDHTVAAGDVCPCSYPSRHASAAAASRTYLAHFAPQRDAEYRYWQDEIDYSRLYMAGHVASDISAGTLLGDALATYVLVTREHAQP